MVVVFHTWKVRKFSMQASKETIRTLTRINLGGRITLISNRETVIKPLMLVKVQPKNLTRLNENRMCWRKH